MERKVNSNKIVKTNASKTNSKTPKHTGEVYNDERLYKLDEKKYPTLYHYLQRFLNNGVDKKVYTYREDPDTPSDFKLEFGNRYFNEIADFNTCEELDNFFDEHTDKFAYGKTTNLEDFEELGILEQISSVYYGCGGYKVADKQNEQLESYIQFSYLFFKTDDKQKAIDYLKSGLAGLSEEDLAKYCQYYKVKDNYIYLEAILNKQLLRD